MFKLTDWTEPKRPVKPSYRYRLNRLAETLVTTERYSPWSGASVDVVADFLAWSEHLRTFLRDGGVVIFDEMDALHPSAEDALALNHALATERHPDFVVVNAVECPYGNPGCMLPDAPIGHGLHKPCVEDAERRDRAMRESMPRITSAEANAEIAAMIEEVTR